MSVNVVCWRWKPFAGYRSTYPAETVNVLRAMVRRHYPDLVRFICVTDDPAGIDPGIEIVPLWNDFADIPSPHGGKNPSCYRRLRMFHPEIGKVFGQRFVSLDLDVVITGDLRPLWNRPEDFVSYGDTNPKTHYNGSMLLLTAGSRPKVWTQFNPATCPRITYRAGFHGSDQAWISYCLGPGEAKWGPKDGVYSFRNQLAQQKQLPDNARIVIFHGRYDPWGDFARHTYPWVARHYRRDQEAA